MQDRVADDLVALAELLADQRLNAGHAVAHTRGEGRVAELYPGHHGRWRAHPSNILVSMDTIADVVVVGAGPAGSAAAAWAARSGRDVLVVDAASFPRDKPCGDGLTPRAIAELQRLGLDDWLDAHIKHRGLRLTGFGGEVEIDWPGPSFPAYGSAVPRTELDERVRQVAVDAGCRMLLGTKVVAAERNSQGRVTSLSTGTGRVACRELIVADGARSPLGRVLGREWHQRTVYGVAVRGYLSSPRADDPWLSTNLELRTRLVSCCPGTGGSSRWATAR